MKEIKKQTLHHKKVKLLHKINKFFRLWQAKNLALLEKLLQSYFLMIIRMLVWFLRYGAQQNFGSFWTIFCPFTSITTQKIKFFKKRKK